MIESEGEKERGERERKREGSRVESAGLKVVDCVVRLKDLCITQL